MHDCSAPSQPLSALRQVADQFKPRGQVTDVQAFGKGNINSTFLVTWTGPTEGRFILQRINTQVFQEPQMVMENIHIFTEHVRRRLQQNPLPEQRRWDIPQVLLTQDQQNYWICAEGHFWRAISYIETTKTLDKIQDHHHAHEVGYALGMFHHLISDLPAHQLADTLEGFHITPQYLQHYEQVFQTAQIRPSPEVDYCVRFIGDRKASANILEKAKAEGKLQLRLIHGDPKINNILIDTQTGQAVSVIDLDTVKPGLVHYDIGDCLRSGCNPWGEETKDWQAVQFDLDLCEALLSGYLGVAKDFLTAEDYDYMGAAIRLIAFELGLRFFTDYLAGNVYFKVNHPDHNLERALVQFKLTESIEAQSTQIEALLRRLQ
ncbi:MAG: aminoglycoside phosphotransferase family protein [Acaryochloridaceae cyanobacterium SU_2_1]|nr:aminoglycoside phosphotransferase family protein [Acaryochloridaceae cyanobacterium SU_2_1]